LPKVKLAVPWRDHNPEDVVEVSDAEAFELAQAGYLAPDDAPKAKAKP
jgi:hypothetical protein